MPSSVQRPQPRDPPPAVERYRRFERAAAWGLTLSAALVAVLVYLSLPLVPGVAAAVLVLLALRVPVLRPSGSARLLSQADPEAVRAEFAGPTPPVLAFQWGVADSVRPTPDGAVYEVSSLFGLLTSTVRVESHTAEDGTVELEVIIGDRRTTTYAVDADAHRGGTAVDVRFETHRRFGLRRLPGLVVAGRFRSAVYDALGYTLLEDDRSLL
jgi:hypothetical protein